MAAQSYRIDPATLPPFDGFRSDAFAFLREIGERQDRAWFAHNRERYEVQARRPMVALLVSLLTAFKDRGVPLRGDPVTSVFRINRDLRFSKDKSPYKTNVSAALTRSGDRRDAGVFYIHLAPEACFAAAGFYNPPPDTLHAIRTHIVEHPRAYRRIVDDLSDAGLVLARDDRLTRRPRGFDAAYPDDIAEALALKSFIVQRTFTRDDAASPTLVPTLVAFASAACPLYRLV